MKPKTLSLVSAALLAAQMLLAAPSHAVEDDRWYSKQQLERGEVLFKQICAACHRQNAEGTADWKRKNANGNYPPPPLNGSAHAWHHDIDLLRRIVRNGGQQFGGVMPAFAQRLSAEEIDSVIAYFQSKWPQDTYQKWEELFGTAEIPSVSDIAAVTNRSVTKLPR